MTNIKILLIITIVLVLSSPAFSSAEVKKELYPSGKLKSEVNVVDGKLEGIAKVYYESGQLQAEENYKNGKVEGITKTYYESGQLENEYNSKNGNIEGIWKIYYESGQLKNEQNSKNGLREGISTIYYESGQLKAEENYEKFRREGISKTYYENGQLREKQNYKNGKKEGIGKVYYESGQLKEEQNYKNGKKESIINTYYESGQLKQETNYKNGKQKDIKKEDISKFYYKKNGKQEDITKTYSERAKSFMEFVLSICAILSIAYSLKLIFIRNAKGCIGFIIYLFIPFSIMIFVVVGPNFNIHNPWARQIEAKANLGRIYLLQEEYFNNHNKYAQNFKELGFTPEEDSPRYTYTFNKHVFELNFEIPKDGFIAIASGNIDSDPIPDVWSINHKKELVKIVDDTKDYSEAIDLNKYFKGTDFVSKIHREGFFKRTQPIQIIFFVFVFLFFITEQRVHRKNKLNISNTTPKPMKLLRLLLLILIIGILAAIAMPNFLRYDAKAKQIEAKVELGKIYRLQEKYFNNHNKYAKNFEELGFTPEEDSPRYTYTLNNENSTSFVAIAKGNVDNDPTVDVWRIDETKTLTNLTNDVIN